MECVEARLDIVESNVEQLHKRLQQIQQETLLELKETVLEELLKEIGTRETSEEKPNAPQRKKDTVENRPYPPVDTRSTPNFP